MSNNGQSFNITPPYANDPLFPIVNLTAKPEDRLGVGFLVLVCDTKL